MKRVVAFVLLWVVLRSFMSIGQHLPKSAIRGQLRWESKENRSDEFNGKEVDYSKWQENVNNFGVWSWSKDNVSMNDGVLNIQVTQETHTRTFFDGCSRKQISNFELYFKSGILKSIATGTYGYYEASMKGAHVFPGVSPAFWLFSSIDRSLNEPGDVRYSEIDVVELQQANWHDGKQDDVQDMDHNLHTIIVGEDGKQFWKRPGSYPDECQNRYRADFDPRNNFHTYAVENRVDSIFWYLDGEEIARKPNNYWHRPMNVTLSMGMRTQHVKWNCNQYYPIDPKSTDTGMPTTMKVDYVRTWEILPSLWMDDIEKYKSLEYMSGTYLDLNIHFHPGSGEKVLSNNWEGVTVRLIEKNELNENVKEYIGSDKSVVNSYGGVAKVAIKLDGVIPTTELPNGHFYQLEPVYTSSKNEGEDVWLEDIITPVKIIANDGTTPVRTVSINPVSNSLAPNTSTALSAVVFPEDATDLSLEWSSSNPEVATVDKFTGEVTAIKEGSVEIIAKSHNGRTDKVTLTVEGGVTSISPKEKKSIIYPNPSKDIINVHFDCQDSTTNIFVLDMRGKVVLSKKADSFDVSIDVSLLSGVYLIKVQNCEGIELHTVIINR